MEICNNIGAQEVQLTRGKKRSLKDIVNHASVSEKSIEAYLSRRVREAGGLCLKFASSTQAGYPDRVVMLPHGLQAWVELKSRGRKPTRLQLLRHDELRAVGQPVYVVDSREGVDSMISELTRPAEP